MKIDLLGYTINLKFIILPIVYITIGMIVFAIIKKIIVNATTKNKVLKVAQKQRVKTLSTVILNIIKYTIVILVILAIASLFGFKVGSILAGLGIGTALIGLALQDLAKDIIAGFSIITEGEYEIGDTIEVDGFMGEVTFIGLRTTRIRNFKGATKIIGNHYMDNVINYSVNNSLAVVDVSIAYETNEKLIEDTFNNLFKELNKKLEYATKDIEVWGVNDLSDSAVIYRVVVETKPMKHIATERILRKEIKQAFDKVGIKIPYTQIEVHNGK